MVCLQQPACNFTGGISFGLRKNNLTPVNLNRLHSVGDELRPLRSPSVQSYKWKGAGVSLLLEVEPEKEHLICYKVPPALQKISVLAKDEFSFVGDKTSLEIVLCLPLGCSAARRVGTEHVQDHHVLGLVLPDIDKIPDMLQPSLDGLVPALTDGGVWLFEFGSAALLESLLGQLQLIGCVMGGFHDQYLVGDVLGCGSFARVFYSEDAKTECPVAVKIVRKEDSQKDAILMKEVRVLRQAQHPSVLKFFGFFEAVDPVDGSEAWAIVTELLEGGELFSLVKQGPMAEDTAADICHQLLVALVCLHEKGIVHRDIKPENVILVSHNSSEVKLADFGLATPETDAAAMKVRCGSPGYIAPEVLRNEAYGKKVDVFSVGALLYTLLVGRSPFKGKALKDVLYKNLRCSFSRSHLNHVSEDARDLVLQLLDPQPETRPTAAEALKHPWLVALVRPRCLSEEGLVDDESFGTKLLTNVDEASTTMTISSLAVTGRRSTGAYTSLLTESQTIEPLVTRCTYNEVPEPSDPNAAVQSTTNLCIIGPDDEDGAHEEEDLVNDSSVVPDLPPLRTQEPVWSEVQRSISSLRMRGLSPRSTLRTTMRTTFDARSARQTEDDGRISLLGGRLTGGRGTLDILDDGIRCNDSDDMAPPLSRRSQSRAATQNSADEHALAGQNTVRALQRLRSDQRGQTDGSITLRAPAENEGRNKFGSNPSKKVSFIESPVEHPDNHIEVAPTPLPQRFEAETACTFRRLKASRTVDAAGSARSAVMELRATPAEDKSEASAAGPTPPQAVAEPDVLKRPTYTTMLRNDKAQHFVIAPPPTKASRRCLNKQQSRSGNSVSGDGDSGALKANENIPVVAAAPSGSPTGRPGTLRRLGAQ